MTGLIGTRIPFCGEGDPYQVNLQQSPIKLLAVPRDGDPGYDPRMAVIAKQVNTLFGALAADLLDKKKKELGKKKAGLDKKELDVLERLEVTVLLDKRGLLPTFSFALPVKERAPRPRRSFSRKLFGWTIPGRKAKWDYSMPPADDVALGKALAKKPAIRQLATDRHP